jgi:LmbE family N-acetylglucosaminyl deacetylase
VEFSERYWPWIAQTADRAGVDVFPMVKDLTLKPGTELEVRSASAAVARNVTRPTVQQYAVVVWDSSRQTVYDIAFSSLTFIQPPGTSSEKPYPLQYVFPDLASVDTSSYRQFERPPFGSTAIRFDRSRTMYEPGDIATVKFTVTNNTDRLWDKVIVRTSLRALGRAEFAKQVLGEDVDVPPRGGRIEQAAKFTLPSDGPGSYRAVVEVSTKAGDVLAAGEIELAANSLPKSILIFCAHEDDEGAHAGMIRAAVENEIPIQIIYITSGDSGSCDRYYEHSCSPAEALNFGVLRMDEARASLAHLGVPRENVHFLGLPDGGSGEIWFKHVEPANPYLSVLLATDHAPYEDIENPNLPYSRKSAVEAAKAFIKQYKPEVIYTGHPDERHVDHRTNNWFVVKAMQELLHGGVISTDVKLLVDQSYGPGPQKHAPYRYEKNILNVSPEVWARAQEARWFYQSQSGNRDLGKIRSLDKLLRQEIHWQVLDWNEHEGWNEKE